jgi:ubiquinone/menaquinone biosynthesis C-methylase UbiE
MENGPSDQDIRRSFAQQVALFSAADSLFARRSFLPSSWLDPVHQEMIVLDAACGAAHAAEQVAPSVRQVVGIDLTPELLAVGADRLRAAGVTNVLLQEGSVETLPFLASSFDLVFCRSALHHLRDPRRAVQEMARVCRPGSRVVVVDMVAPSAEVRGAFDEQHRRIDPSHVGVLLDTEIVTLLGTEVGPITYGNSPDPFKVPFKRLLTSASAEEAATSALRAEIEGGQVTGFNPEVEAMRFTFRSERSPCTPPSRVGSAAYSSTFPGVEDVG